MLNAFEKVVRIQLVGHLYLVGHRAFTDKTFPGTVKAVQNGAVIFVLMCSFHKPEPWQPSHQWPMPPNVPSPEECDLDEITLARRAAKEGVNERVRNIFEVMIEVGDPPAT